MLDPPHNLARAGTTGGPARSARPVLSVGATGHRAARLEGIGPATLEAAVAATLARIEQAAIAVADDVELRAITALADGADSIVAEAAMQRGWSLLSILPFAREHYAADFTSSQSLATYDRLIAASQRVVEPAGQHEDPAVAYERAGRIVLAQADILIAIWDGDPPRGRGGTAQIVAEAVARGIAVIRIDPCSSSAPALLWDGLTGHDAGRQDVDTVPRAGLDALPRLIRGLLLGR